MLSRPQSDAVAQVARIAHDLGAAGLLGGSLFGRFALHPAVGGLRDNSERGKVVNAAWRRYGAINAVSLAAVSAGWVSARATEARPTRLSEREEHLALAKDALLVAVAASGIATASSGIRFSRQAPGGGVPLEDGDTPAYETTREGARLKRRLTGSARSRPPPRSATSLFTRRWLKRTTAVRRCGEP